jgi:hypothetical protein
VGEGAGVGDGVGAGATAVGGAEPPPPSPPPQLANAVAASSALASLLFGRMNPPRVSGCCAPGRGERQGAALRFLRDGVRKRVAVAR